MFFIVLVDFAIFLFCLFLFLICFCVVVFLFWFCWFVCNVSLLNYLPPFFFYHFCSSFWINYWIFVDLFRLVIHVISKLRSSESSKYLLPWVKQVNMVLCTNTHFTFKIKVKLKHQLIDWLIWLVNWSIDLIDLID